MIILMSEYPDENFLERLNLPISFAGEHTDWDDVTGLLLDWFPKTSEYKDAWFIQASLLQKFIKKEIPIVIFDRSFSLTEKEVSWLNKHNVHLFEPALNSGRSGFGYLPEWIHSFEIAVDDKDRVYDMVYSHRELEYNIKGFDKYVRDYARLFPDDKVAYATPYLSDFKKEEYKNNNLIHVEHYPIYNEGNFTVAIDRDKMYEMGYFNPIYFSAMNNGCLPLLPEEHKYFHGMFRNLIFNDLEELNYYISRYAHIKDVLIEDIFGKIKKEWNEFTVDHAVDVIRRCYE